MILKNSRTSKVLALSLGQTLTAVSALISTMVAARILTKFDYATFKQTLLAYNFVAPLLLLGLPNAVYYFIPREKKNEKNIILEVLILIFILSIFFSLFLLFGGGNLLAKRFDNPALAETLEWMIFYPIYVMPTSIVGAVLLTQNRLKTLVTYNVLTTLLLTIATIAAIFITKNYEGPLLVQIFLPIIFLPIALWLIFKDLNGLFEVPNVKRIIGMLKYSIPIGLAGMLGLIMLQTDKMIVSLMSSPVDFANYINGAIEIPLIGVITGSISSVILVDMTTMIAKKDMTSALELFKTAALRSASILFPVMIFLLAAGKPFILTLFSEKYLESVVPFYIYLFILPIRIVVYGSALMALGFSKVILVRSFFDLLINLCLSVILVYFFGYLGAAFATILTLYIWTVPYNLVKIGQGFGVKTIDILPLKPLIKTLLICVICSPLALAHHLLPDNNWLLELFIAALLYFPAVLYILHRNNLFIIPVNIINKLPEKFRSIVTK